MASLDVYTQTIGRVTDTGRLVINDLIDIDKKQLADVYLYTLENILQD